MLESFDQRCKCHRKSSVALYTDWEGCIRLCAHASLMRSGKFPVSIEFSRGQTSGQWVW